MVVEVALPPSHCTTERNDVWLQSAKRMCFVASDARAPRPEGRLEDAAVRRLAAWSLQTTRSQTCICGRTCYFPRARFHHFLVLTTPVNLTLS